MFAVVNHLEFTKPVDEFRDIVQNDAIAILQQHAGFRDLHFVKVDEHKAIVLLLWEDAASAMAGAKSFGPSWFATNFRPYLVGDENRTTGEIVASTYFS